MKTTYFLNRWFEMIQKCLFQREMAKKIGCRQMVVSGGFAAVSSHSIINIIKATAIPKSHHCESFLADLLKTLKCNKITNINMKPYYNLKYGL